MGFVAAGLEFIMLELDMAHPIRLCRQKGALQRHPLPSV